MHLIRKQEIRPGHVLYLNLHRPQEHQGSMFKECVPNHKATSLSGKRHLRENKNVHGVPVWVRMCRFRW